MSRQAPQPARILFLDDAPKRGEAFLADHPGATWVQTVEDCLARLREPWDEVHLDHDLGGEVLVDHERKDCGMEVVRWLCEEPQEHLRMTRFLIHTHNPNAADMMFLHLQMMGYQVAAHRFGAGREPVPRARAPWHARLFRWLGLRGQDRA